MARNPLGATAVVDRKNDSFDADYGPTTRDIPLPSRSLRLGLSSTSAPTITPSRTTISTASSAKTIPASPDDAATGEIAVIESDDAPAAATPTADTPISTTPPVALRTDRGEGPSGSLKARTALVAMAAGAVAVAVSSSGSTAEAPQTEPVALAAAPNAAAPNAADGTPAAAAADTDGGVVPAVSTSDMDGYSSQLAVGKQLAAAAAAREAASRKPLFAAPITAKYAFTSGYAMRWGSFHGGLDLAAPLGTPIHAVTDGVVEEAGPASGYGNWIQIKADDGTITMYGHMAASGVLVSKGQKVTAGDVIGLVGSEGFSTGPHLHFEVWKNGSTKIDPAPWLANKGIRLNSYTG